MRSQGQAELLVIPGHRTRGAGGTRRVADQAAGSSDLGSADLG